ncbi:class I SAM-dependent methyltransferase [Thiosocius teredinicola]|uniref:class I SAM-dependent methyltransferase n=1 Tax=Thiosocius teredinicola TaxID=1973002 RepID=UPI000F792669
MNYRHRLKGVLFRFVSNVKRGRLLFNSIKRTRAVRYLNVGCGRNTREQFINLDYAWRPGIDLCWDIRERIPIEDGALHGIFTEHCLEHIAYNECVSVFRDFFRLLAPGGVVRVIVPDGGKYLELYSRALKGEDVVFPYVGAAGKKDLEVDSQIKFTPMMAVNRIFRSYGHQFAYDAETLKAMLAHAGFIEAKQVEFGEGVDPKLIIDSSYREPQSLYIEAQKPHSNSI